MMVLVVNGSYKKEGFGLGTRNATPSFTSNHRKNARLPMELPILVRHSLGGILGDPNSCGRDLIATYLGLPVGLKQWLCDSTGSNPGATPHHLVTKSLASCNLH